MTFEKALIVSSDKKLRLFLKEVFEKRKAQAITVDSPQIAKDMLKSSSFDMLLFECEEEGLSLLNHIKELEIDLLTIAIVSLTSLEKAVLAMKKGAFNYLIKPFSEDVIHALIEKAEQHTRLLQKESFFSQEVSHQEGSKHSLIAKSPPMQEILNTVQKVARSNASVFISGESGTGKEVIARALHTESFRKHQPFIRVNCAAIPALLLESEFFGHEKGAFTGAFSRRIGRFEMAHKGTLLLDEISEIPIELQAKLLRAVQEQEFERVGGTTTIGVDVRFIATSNRNLQECIEEKSFREDLYYRLNVVPIHLPPLRDRKEDIIPLAEYFLEKLALENHKKKLSLSEEAKKVLLDYPWPGNVRELANIMERTVVLSVEDTIIAEDLSLDIKAKFCVIPPTKSEEGLIESLATMEQRLITKALEATGGNKTRAAQLLGISVRTLRNKLQAKV